MEWKKKKQFPVMGKPVGTLYRDPLVTMGRKLLYDGRPDPPEDKGLMQLMSKCSRAKYVPMKAYIHEEASSFALGDVLGDTSLVSRYRASMRA